MNSIAETSATVGRLTAQFKAWGTDLKKLTAARGTRAGAMTRLEYDRQLADVGAKLDVARLRLQNLKEAGSAATEAMIERINLSSAEVTNAFDGVAARFKVR
jgi:hypothetical protein